jgi:FtsZ-binding cell division protein ZapB
MVFQALVCVQKKEMESTIASLKADLEAVMRTNDTLQKEHDALKREQAEMRSEQDAVSGERDAWKAKFDGMLDAFHAHQQAVDNVRS